MWWDKAHAHMKFMMLNRLFKVGQVSKHVGIIVKQDFIVAMSVTVKEDMVPQYVEIGEILLTPFDD